MMSIPAVTWDSLLINAEKFHLDMEKFTVLKEFFDRCDRKYFQECATKVNRNFPLEEVIAKFSESDLHKFLLLCIVANFGAMEEYYRANNFPQEMFDEISYDLLIWLNTLKRDLGGYGLTPRIFGWESECLRGEVKQFGRLQANDIHSFAVEKSIYRDANGILQIARSNDPQSPADPLLTYGDKVINLHIPASGQMTREKCIASLRKIIKFSADFHPDYDYKAIVCYSWLLDKQFGTFLSPESNVMQFQELGHNFPLDADETREIIWRIWGKPGVLMQVKDLPAKSSMEKGVKQFILDGGRFIEGLLVIFKDELPELLE